jgi:hypothetical protein
MSDTTRVQVRCSTGVLPCILLVFALLPAATMRADEEQPAADTPKPTQNAVEPQPAGTKRALVLCGHPGDGEHAVRYADVTTRIVSGLVTRLGFAEPNVVVLAGVEADEGDDSLKADWPAAARGPATRETLTAAVESIKGELAPEDTLWVIVIGHAHMDGRLSWLNLPGPDLHHDEFGRLWKETACREQVFIMTTPASGYFAKSLAAPGRVVMTATEADLEVNETLSPDALAEVLNPSADKPLPDCDDDAAITLFDLYIEMSRNVARRYAAETLISTEHGLLEDNGDGRGTELQRDYLSEAEGGRARRGTPPKPPAGRDGALSTTIRLPFEVPPKVEPAKVEEPAPEAPKKEGE